MSRLERNRHSGFKNYIRNGFIGSILAAFLITVLSVIAIQSIRHARHNFLYQTSQELFSTKNLIYYFEARTSSFYAFLLTGNNKYLNRKMANENGFLNSLEAIRQTSQDSAVLQFLEDIIKINTEYQKHINRAIDLKLSQQILNNDFDNSILPTSQKLFQTLKAFELFQQQRYEQVRQQFLAISNRIFASFILLAILAILLASALGLLFSTTVIRLYRKSEETLTHLRRSKALTNSIIESALDCIISIDDQGRIIRFNSAAERTFGYSRFDVLGRDMPTLLIPPSFRAMYQTAFNKYSWTKESLILGKRIETIALKKDKTKFNVEMTITEIKFDGQHLFTGFLRDITDRKKAEGDKIKAIQARDELVGVISHELKNPLTAIFTSTELLIRAFQNVPNRMERERSLIERVQEATQRMNRLISDLLDITQIESGHLQLEIQENSVAFLIESAIQRIQPLAHSKQIKIETNISSDTPWIYCDKDRIIQVLCRLLENSIKFSPDQSTIEINATSTDANLILSVKDHGPGIPSSDLNKIFDRFWQAKQTAFKGTGLGLPISKGIIEAHGGKLWVKSELGIGTQLFFTLKRVSSFQTQAVS